MITNRKLRTSFISLSENCRPRNPTVVVSFDANIHEESTRISAYTLYLQKLVIGRLHCAANSMGLSSFKFFVVGSVKCIKGHLVTTVLSKSNYAEKS